MEKKDAVKRRYESIRDEISRHYPLIFYLWKNHPEIVKAISSKTAYFFNKAQWTATEDLIVMKKVIINTWINDYGNYLRKHPNTDLLIKVKEIQSSIKEKNFLEYTTPNNYLNISKFPDDFYKDIIDLINRCYHFRVIPAVFILTRKLLENLIIDILRKKYGMQNTGFFFDVDHSKFHSFNTLLQNFQRHSKDFKMINPNLNKEFFKKLNHYRERGNSSAHSLEIFVEKKVIDDEKDQLEFLVKALIRLEHQL